MDSYYKKGREIVKKILDAGYQAFFVGGFVRDRLLGLDAGDIDITTDAVPDQIMKLFPKAKATGLRYGTVTVFKDKDSFEVTTFRSDGEYLNHRKPKEVAFSKDLKTDLERRDFTINAFAMNYDEEIVDLFEGRTDLEHHLIRAIGDPDKRFNEDALRILRAFRFVSKLGFDIEEKTFTSIKNDMQLLKHIANERVLVEFKKILGNSYSLKSLQLLEEAAIENAFPELAEGIRQLNRNPVENVGYIEFFALCFDLYKGEIPETWRFSNKDRSIIEKVIELISIVENNNYNEMLIYRLGKEIPLMANRVAQILDTQTDQSKQIKEIYRKLPIKKTSDLEFKGQDILELTSEENAEIIGEIIEDITYQVITHQLTNNYNEIKEYTEKLLESKYGKK